MLINIQLCQRTDINLEFILIRQSCRQFWDSDSECLQLPAHHLPPSSLAYEMYSLCPVLKLKVGSTTSSPFSRRQHICHGTACHIYRLQDISKSYFPSASIGVSSRSTKIIIYRNRMRYHAICLKLYGQTMGKCRLTGR